MANAVEITVAETRVSAASPFPVTSTIDQSANIANAQVTVDTTAGGVSVVAARAGRQSVTIVNLGTTDVWLGAGTVSDANGVLLLGVKGAAITIATQAAVKGFVASGSQAVSVLETY